MASANNPSPKRKRSNRTFDFDSTDPSFVPLVDRLSGEPTLKQLDEALGLIKQFDPVNVYLTRMQLKWLVKACNKYFNMHIKNPYGK